MENRTLDPTLQAAEDDASAPAQRRTNRYPRGRFFMKENEKGGLRQHPLEIGGIHSVRKPKRVRDWSGIYADKRGWIKDAE